MVRRPAVVRHSEAGWVEPVRVGVRYAEAADAPCRPDAPDAEVTFGESMLSPGRVRVGPCEVRLSLDSQGERALFDLGVRNLASSPVRLDALVLGFRWLPPETIGTRGLHFLRHGWQSWSVTGARELDEQGEPDFPSGSWLRGMFHALGTSPSDRRGWHESELFSLVGVGTHGAACLLGALERGRQFAVVYLRPEANAVRIEIELRDETPLEPGALRQLEPVRIALGNDANRLLATHCNDYAREADARNEAPFQAGWCSWYQFFADVCEEDMLRNLEALRQSELPIQLVQLDDGYQRELGDWRETNEKFPRGLGPLAEAIRGAGFRAGLWTAPWLVSRESQMFEQHPDWLLHDDEDYFRALHHPIWSKYGWIHALDTSRDDVLRHLEDCFRDLTAMGWDYHKLDFLYPVAMQAIAADPKVSRAERLTRGLAAVRAGAGDDSYLLGCGCPLGPAVGIVDGMRISPDVAPNWEVKAEIAIPGMKPTQPSLRNALRNSLARAFMHRRLWANDPDCLMARATDTDLSAAEVRSLAAVVGGSGGSLVISDDLARLDDEALNLVRETLALGRQVDEAAARGGLRILGLLEAETPHGLVAQQDDVRWLTLFNGGEESALRQLEDAGVRKELAPHESASMEIKANVSSLAVFCDFDGTFLVQDVGATLARQYNPEARPVQWARYERGEINPWEYNLQVLNGMPCNEQQTVAFLDSVQLDPGARNLLAWCAKHRIPFRVLSDGFDRNLDWLAKKFDISFEYDANRLDYEDDRWRIQAGYPNSDCTCGTGVCKRARIEAFRAAHPGVRTVHIGNGRVSDLCGADAADLAFAKGSLAEEMDKRGMTFERFETLDDVIAALERVP